MSKTQEEFYYNKRALFTRSLLCFFGGVLLLILFYENDSKSIKGNILIEFIFFCILLGSYIIVYLLYFKRLFQIKPAFCINHIGIHYNGKTFLWNEIHDVSCNNYYRYYKDETPILRFYTEKKHQIFLCLEYADYEKVFNLLKTYCSMYKISYSNHYIDETEHVKNIHIVWQQIFDIILLLLLIGLLIYRQK